MEYFAMEKTGGKKSECVINGLFEYLFMNKIFTSQSPQRIFLILLLLWAILKVLSAAFTDISSDEAYYAMYARYMDWGYFDHPPMVAFFIKIGSFICGQLGARLFAIISQLMTLILLWFAIKEEHPAVKKVFLFFGLAASITMFQVYGFIMTPDVPLLLFSTFFLLTYKYFLEKNSLSLALLLGIAMAGMIYSKYHAFLFIALVVLSNLKLLKNRNFWIGGIFTILLLIPHIYWQYEHHFPSFSYHLIDRSDGFKPFYLIEFWYNQLLVFNPVMFILSIVLLFKYKPENQFDRSLFFIIGGFLFFFFFASFKGHVEPHWTTVICLPMIILFYKFALQQVWFYKATIRYIFPFIIILLWLNVELVTDTLHLPLNFAHNRSFFLKMDEKAGDKTIVFQNSYQKPSLYNYYTCKNAVTINNLIYRQNQFDIWNFDEALYNQPVWLAVEQHCEKKKLTITDGKKRQDFIAIEHFMPISKVKIDFDLKKTEFFHNEQVRIPIMLTNPYPFDIDFQHEEFPVSIWVVFAKDKGRWSDPCQLSEPVLCLKAGETIQREITFRINANHRKKIQVGFSLYTPLTSLSFNSRFIKIKIVK
jgi:hypothetical protein